MISFASKPLDAINGSIWSKPTRRQRLSEILFGWYLVRGGSYDQRTGEHMPDREYFPPAMLAWIKNNH